MGHYIDGKNEANGPVAALYSRSPCCSSVHALSCKRHRDATNLSEVTARRVSTELIRAFIRTCSLGSNRREISWRAWPRGVAATNSDSAADSADMAVRVRGAEVSLGK